MLLTGVLSVKGQESRQPIYIFITYSQYCTAVRDGNTEPRDEYHGVAVVRRAHGAFRFRCSNGVLHGETLPWMPSLSPWQVRFIGDQNPFRESSAGVQFFGVSTLNPELYTVQKGGRVPSQSFVFSRGHLLA